MRKCTIENDLLGWGWFLHADGKTVGFKGQHVAERFYSLYKRLGYEMHLKGSIPDAFDKGDGLPDDLPKQVQFTPVVLTTRFSHPESVPEELALQQLAAIFGDGKKLVPFIQYRREAVGRGSSAVTTFGRVAVMPTEYFNDFALLGKTTERGAF